MTKKYTLSDIDIKIEVDTEEIIQKLQKIGECKKCKYYTPWNCTTDTNCKVKTKESTLKGIIKESIAALEQ